MKAAQLKKLLRLAESRRRLNEMRLAAVRHEQAALNKAGEALNSTASEPYQPAEESDGEGELAAYGRYLRFLDMAASQKFAAAIELDPLRANHETSLRQSLSEEMAWRKLDAAATATARKKAQELDEAKREAITLDRFTAASRARRQG